MEMGVSQTKHLHIGAHLVLIFWIGDHFEVQIMCKLKIFIESR